MSQWVLKAYRAELEIEPCEGDMAGYAGEVEEALKRYGLKEFEGFSLKSLFFASAGFEPLSATLTSAVGRSLMEKASSLSQHNRVWHLEFDGAPFSVDLAPLSVDDLWMNRRVASRPMRKVEGNAKAPILVSTPYADLTWFQYAFPPAVGE